MSEHLEKIGPAAALNRAKAGERQRIIAALEDVDRKSVRPLRTGDTDRLRALEDEARVLRAQLAELAP